MTPFDSWRGWTGTVQAALAVLPQLASELDLMLDLPNERVLRDWRAKGLITKHQRLLTGHNLLEILRAKQLRDLDLPNTLIRQHLHEQTDTDLLAALTGITPAPATSSAPAELTADLTETDRVLQQLAAAILDQYNRVTHGKLVGIYTDIPLSLRQAQAYLSRMNFRFGGCTINLSSVHELLHACTQPLSDWAPRPLAEHPEHHDVILIEDDLYTPSPDCALLAEQGGHLENLIEVQWHGRFQDALDRLHESHRDDMYTRIRRFIAEHPLVTTSELLKLKRNPRVQMASEITQFIDSVYQPVHPFDTVNRTVLRCEHCQGPIRDNRCRLPTCRSLNPTTTQTTPVPMDQAYIAHSALLRYWCDPAQEELRLYRHLTQFHPKVHLYPQSDACDVAIGTEHGVDIKDYTDPLRLADKLNSGIGRFRLYKHKYLAIATRRVRDDSYIPRLRERLNTTLKRDLEILSVEEAMDKLAALKGDHA
ncbi:hypothetical protein [Deinococcus aestuarii]|uniref:restriction endonuclease-related protein n=1 Tax=Deinococcus aestuarii TaxID=2774531 RepID=UPI001C0B6F13|nr:hypothetical protein [Deinococcus aestuarii]